MITSLENKKIKEIVKLKQKKYRDKEAKFIIETPNLIEEAYKQNLLLELFVLDRYKFSLNVATEYVTKQVMSKISSLENSYVLGICKKQITKGLVGNRYLLLDNIQDPGNLGTIIRTALGFNIDTIVLSEETCDLYNEKVIRATEGALFKINIIRRNLVSTIKELKQKNITIYGTNVDRGKDLKNITPSANFALVMGNEGNGITKEIASLTDTNICITTNKELESLNVGVATGIILYQLTK